MTRYRAWFPRGHTSNVLRERLAWLGGVLPQVPEFAQRIPPPSPRVRRVGSPPDGGAIESNRAGGECRPRGPVRNLRLRICEHDSVALRPRSRGERPAGGAGSDLEPNR